MSESAAEKSGSIGCTWCVTAIDAANAEPWDAAQYLSEGVDAVVEKPIKVERLAEAITAATVNAALMHAATQINVKRRHRNDLKK